MLFKGILHRPWHEFLKELFSEEPVYRGLFLEEQVARMKRGGRPKGIPSPKVITRVWTIEALQAISRITAQEASQLWEDNFDEVIDERAYRREVKSVSELGQMLSQVLLLMSVMGEKHDGFLSWHDEQPLEQNEPGN